MAEDESDDICITVAYPVTIKKSQVIDYYSNPEKNKELQNYLIWQKKII